MEANDLPRFGPSGTYSQAWMSRADQSLKSTTPKMCRSASSTAMGSPARTPVPTTKPSSASMSRRVPTARTTGPRRPGGPCADRTAAGCRCPRPRSSRRGRGSRRQVLPVGHQRVGVVAAGRAGRGSRRGARRRRSRRSRRPRRAGAGCTVGERVDGLGRAPRLQPLLRAVAARHLHPPLVALGHERVEARPGEHVVAEQHGQVDDGVPEPGGHAGVGAGDGRRRTAGCRARTAESSGTVRCHHQLAPW